MNIFSYDFAMHTNFCPTGQSLNIHQFASSILWVALFLVFNLLLFWV
jgi:hypothetical protein